MRHPEVLFETPDTWGRETFYVSRTELRRIVSDLRRNLGWDANPSETVKWEHVGHGVYESWKGRVLRRARFKYCAATRSWEPVTFDEFERDGNRLKHVWSREWLK